MADPVRASRRKIRPALAATVLLLVIGTLLVLHARRPGLIGHWQMTDRADAGVLETTSYRFHPWVDTLTLDKLDGSPLTVLARQHL